MSKHVHENAIDIVNRLSKIEGHIRGIKKMVADGKDCEEVLMQVAAVQASLRNASILLLQDHVDHCLVEEIKEGNIGEPVEKFNRALKYILKNS